MNRLNLVTEASSLRRWISIAVCCVPAIVVAAAVGLGVFANLRTSTAGANPIFLLFTLACPVGMGLMMWLMAKDMNMQPSHAKTSDQPEADSGDRLTVLYQERELLETEIAELEAKTPTSLTDEAPAAPDDYRFSVPETK